MSVGRIPAIQAELFLQPWRQIDICWAAGAIAAWSWSLFMQPLGVANPDLPQHRVLGVSIFWANDTSLSFFFHAVHHLLPLDLCQLPCLCPRHVINI